MAAMRKYSLLAMLLIVLLPAPAGAWGLDAHRFIMDRAIALLPDAIRPVFEKYRARVVERATDPDTWRIAGFEEEPPHHFLDLDWEGYGKYPFTELPRDYAAAVGKFGVTRIRDNGTLPWRIEEMYGNLRRAFQDAGRGGLYGLTDSLLFAPWLAHYVSDAHVPFHAVINFDGQLTNQNGVHARFETLLFNRYQGQLKIAPQPIAPITNPRDFAFSRLLEGTQLTPEVLKADMDAIGNRDVYDDAYFAAFFAADRPILERRINESIASVAAIIVGAWEAAGKPALPLEPPNPTQRRRR